MGHLFFTILATFWSLQSSIVEDWVLFVDPLKQFEVTVPDSAILTTTKVSTALGDLEYVVVTSKDVANDQVILYSLSYCDYPEGIFHPDSIELIDLFFNETVAEAVKSVDGSLLYSEDIPFSINYGGGIYPTRLWKIVSEKLDIYVKSKAMLVGDRYYCLQVSSPVSQNAHVNDSRFFDSFKVTR